MVVPGSGSVRRQAEAKGIVDTVKSADFYGREPGFSMCFAMNDDFLQAGDGLTHAKHSIVYLRFSFLFEISQSERPIELAARSNPSASRLAPRLLRADPDLRDRGARVALVR
ncbi:aconitase family protein [Burkholderia sp. S171]|uniref:aconitase family protein n=1 Tax=Burkholderia sp. S171 TaxID=1641860 RepID=UPI00131C5017